MAVVCGRKTSCCGRWKLADRPICGPSGRETAAVLGSRIGKIARHAVSAFATYLVVCGIYLAWAYWKAAKRFGTDYWDGLAASPFLFGLAVAVSIELGFLLALTEPMADNAVHRPSTNPSPASPTLPMHLRAFALVLLLPCLLTGLVVHRVNGQSTDVLFERDIRPIFKEHCWHCHGEEAEVEGNLDLRLAHFMLAGGDSGPALVAGDHADSLVYQRIADGDMPPGEIKVSADQQQLLARWIDTGAKTAHPEPETLPVGDIFTEADRDHWAFREVVRPPVPHVPGDTGIDNPIDAFLWQRLNEHDLTFSPPADRATLLRRLTFNLTGLPPTPEQISAFVADPAPDAYRRVVDSLLESPAYGQRWARHWLDVVGYADSDGYTSNDHLRPWAWKYRDYVIDAFNDDKPWDHFIVEQLAGDELVTARSNLSPEQAERLIATGMLRMGPDGTGGGADDQAVARNDVLAETIKIVSTSLLGLTVGCAQCHSHRYDPISHIDYHRMRALFEPAYDPNNWRAPADRLVSQWSDATRQRVTEVDAQLKALADERTAALDRLVEETFERELAKLPEATQPLARQTRTTPAKERSEDQKALINQYPFLNVNRSSVYLYLPDRQRGFNKQWDDKQTALQAQRPADDLIHCLTEVSGKVPETRLFFRGDISQPRDVVAPGELAVLDRGDVQIPTDDVSLPSTGRRLAYAKHLTNGRHPLVARVLVNRFWMHHFGQGLVATPGDFGMLGEPPSHPELLDWLAAEFVENGWSLKRLHREILNTQAYRQASLRSDLLDRVDPDNRLLGRMSVRRLVAEEIRDGLLFLSAELSGKQGGAPVPVAPDDVGQYVVAVDNRDSAGRPSRSMTTTLGEEEFRRSVYVHVRRSMPLSLLEPFDMPDLSPNCERRSSSTVAPQSLLLLNNLFVIDRCRAIAESLVRDMGDDPETLFVAAWQMVLGQSPNADQVARGLAYLSEQTAYFATTDNPQAKQQPHIAALATLCQALVSSGGFLYVD